MVPMRDEKPWGLSMNPRVLPASCRQTNRRKALPARCRQHLGGAVSSVGGSWSQSMRETKRGLFMNRPTPDTLQAGSRRSMFDVRCSMFDVSAITDETRRLALADSVPAAARGGGHHAIHPEES